MGQQSVFQRLAAHTQMYAGPIITPIYSNQQELILGGFSNEQIVSIQQQLEPVVQAGRLQVKALGSGRLNCLDNDSITYFTLLVTSLKRPLCHSTSHIRGQGGSLGPDSRN